MAAEGVKALKLGSRVEITGKGLIGTIAYNGPTMFSSGKWIGVILDDAKGKNNGTLQGKTYFTCPDNHGIFVRQTQVSQLSDASPDERPITPPISTQAMITSQTTPATDKKAPRRSGLRPPSMIAKKFGSPRAGSENLSDGGSPASASEPPSKEASPIPKSGPPSKEGSPAAASERTALAPKTGERAIPTPKAPRESGLPVKGLRSSKEAISTEETTPAPVKAVPVSKIGSIPTKIAPSSVSAPAAAPVTPSPAPAPEVKRSTPQSSASDISMMSSAVSTRIEALQQQQEMDGLRAEIRDLNERLETLKIRRQEDKAKLKEFEKAKIQLQQLLGYKQKMQESHADIQRQLQTSKKDAHEIQEAYDNYKDEMAESSELIEMVTLDKDMAEEKAESLQAEVEQLNSRVEELNLELEVLKGEMSEQGSEGMVNNYQNKQLEQQNERLKDALVKLRDISNQEKHDAQKMKKQVEKLTTDLTSMKSERDKNVASVETLSEQMLELQEQVDAALGSEEMVEKLTERNSKLEERIEALDEEKADLETMNEMNEEMQESCRLTELEIREDLDLAVGKTSEMKRKLDATQETIADYEGTIGKYRDLVMQLKEQITDLKSQQAESDKKAETPIAQLAFDFKSMFAETKAYSKTIDMELRKLEVEQSKQHVSILRSFMPDTFLARAGDHDAVLVLLLIPRVICKAELLASQVRDKYEMLGAVEADHVLKSHDAEQSSYASLLVLLLNILQCVLRQYESALKTCTVDLFLKIGTLHPEMAAHEKSVDYFIELLRKGQLDESVPIDLLEKTINYFQQLYLVHLSKEKVDCTGLMTDNVRLVLSACDCVQTDLGRLKILLMTGQEQSEFSILLRDLETCNNDTRTCARKIKIRLPRKDGSVTMSPLSLPRNVQELLQSCATNITQVAKTMHSVGFGAMQQAHIMTDAEGLMPKKLEELAYQATDQIYGKEEDMGPFDLLRLSFGQVVGTMNKMANAMENGEYDFDGTHEKQIIAPVVERARIVKSKISDMEILKFKLESKEEDVMELKRQLKIKQEELSEQMLRVGVIEKKLQTASQDSNDRVEKIQRKLDEANVQLRKKEREFDKTMDTLQADIDNLELEKGELRDRLKTVSKRILLEGITRQSKETGDYSRSDTETSLELSRTEVSVQDSPLLLQEIQSLKEALRIVKHDNIYLRGEKMKAQIDALPSLKVPKNSAAFAKLSVMTKTDEPSNDDKDIKRITSLSKQLSKVYAEANRLAACPHVVDITKRKPGAAPLTDSINPAKQLLDRTAQLAAVRQKADKLQAEVMMFVAEHRAGGQVRTDFASFPTPQFSRVMHERAGDTQLLARIVIPTPGVKSETIKLNVSLDEMDQIHRFFLSTKAQH